MSRFALLAFTLFSSLALAAPNVRTGAGSSGCCSVLIAAVFIYIYRSGGTDWLRSIGAAFFPGLVVLLAGHQAVRQQLGLCAGDSALNVVLEPGVKWPSARSLARPTSSSTGSGWV